MKQRRRADRWLLSCLLVLSLPVAAQDTFRYRIPVDTPVATDFYRIVLPPDLVARSNYELSDLRILGPDGRWSLVAPVSIDPRDRAFRIPAARTRRLKIEIDNADNAPLRVAGVSAKQAGIYLLTYLQAGHDYALLTGDPKADAPRYDLAYFTDSLTRRPRDIGTGAGRQRTTVVTSSNVPVTASADKQGGRPGFLLWSILSTVLLLLIYFSVKMVGAIQAKKDPHDRV